MTIRSIETAALAVTVGDDLHPRYKRGPATIPREEIVGMEVRRRGKRGRIIGTTVGAAAGFFGAVVLADVAFNRGRCRSGSCGATAISVASITSLAAGPIVGYLFGSRSDGKNTTIILLPD